MPNHFPDFNKADNYASGYMLATDAQGRYRSQCIEGAIRSDNDAAIEECVASGWMVPESRALFNDTPTQYCEIRKAPKCAAKLRSLGFA